jgi:hypothetical protein
MGNVRLRQAVAVAADLEAAASQLRSALNLGEPFRDPGVGEFGLENTVFALGDCFLEVVSPKQPGTAAGRQLERQGGDGGYMVIFDVEDLDGARERAAALGVRTVFEIDLPDISTTHLHPADIGGAIVSIDSSRPYGTWRWGGPQWTGQRGVGAPGRLAGVTLAVADPAGTAARWAEVLGIAVDDGDASLLRPGDTEVRFEALTPGQPERLLEIAVQTPEELPGAASALDIGGLRLRRLAPA